MMKLALISDIHGNLAALQAVLAEVDAATPDEIWVLGDHAAHGPDPAACVQLLRERHAADEKHFRVIGGNTDRYLVTGARFPQPPAKDADAYQFMTMRFSVDSQILDWGRAQLGWENYEFLTGLLGKEIYHQVDGYGLVSAYHAVPGNDEQNVLADTPDEEVLDSVLDRAPRLGLYGHIHRQVNRRVGNFHLVNPGSVGMSFEQPGTAQYALLTFADGEVQVDLRGVPYDVDALLEHARTVGHPGVGFLEVVLREAR